MIAREAGQRKMKFYDLVLSNDDSIAINNHHTPLKKGHCLLAKRSQLTAQRLESQAKSEWEPDCETTNYTHWLWKIGAEHVRSWSGAVPVGHDRLQRAIYDLDLCGGTSSQCGRTVSLIKARTGHLSPSLESIETPERH